MKKWIAMVMLIAMLLALVPGCSSGEAEELETTEVFRGDMVVTIPVSGNLEMPEKVNLSFGMSGEVIEVFVDKGDMVKKDQVLARLDTSAIEAQLDVAQLRLKALEIDYQIARNNLMQTIYPRYTGTFLNDLAGTWLAIEEIEAILTEARDLVEDWDAEGVALQLDEAEASLEKAKEKLHKGRWPMPFFVKTIELQTDQAALAIDIALAEMETIKVALPDAVLISPISGEVTWTELDRLEHVMATSPVITITDTSVLKMKAIADEMDMPDIKLGGEVEVTLDAWPDQQIEGVITYISPVGTQQSGIVFYETTIEMTNPGEELRDGMSATADIITDERNGVLLVPMSALIRESGNYYVMKVIDEETTEKTQVKVGLDNDRYMEIIGGVSEGDKIVIPD
jgi:RND family efflux transporter MFP subunit